METRGKKNVPVDKLYFCQTEGALSVHHYAIDKPENKRILSIYPDQNKKALSNPRLTCASNGALKDQESFASLLQPEQKFSSISRDSFQKQLEYKSSTTASQGSEVKKTQALVSNSRNNEFREAFLKKEEEKNGKRRLSAPGEMSKGQSNISMETASQEKNSTVSALSKLFDQQFSTVTDNNTKRAKNTANPLIKPAEKSTNVDKADINGNEKLSSAINENQTAAGGEEKQSDSLSLLTKACEILIENTMLTKQTSHQSTSPALNLNRKQKNMPSQPDKNHLTKPQNAVSNLLEKMFYSQPQRNQSLQSKHVTEADSEISSITTGEGTRYKEYRKQLKADAEISKSSRKSKYLKQFINSEKRQYFHNDGSINKVYTARPEFMRPSENDQSYISESNSRGQTSQHLSKKRKPNKSDFQASYPYHSNSDENYFTHSEYSEEPDNYHYSEYSDESVSPGEGDIKQPQRFRTFAPKVQQRREKWTSQPSYSHSEKFSRTKDKENSVYKNYLRKLYAYTSDKIRKFVQTKPEKVGHEKTPKKYTLTQGIQTIQVDNQDKHRHRKALTTQSIRKKVLPQVNKKLSNRASYHKKAAINDDTILSRKNKFENKRLQSSKIVHDASSVDGGRTTSQTRDITLTKPDRQRITYQHKFTSTDVEDKSLTKLGQTNSNEIQTETDHKTKTNQSSEYSKKNPALRSPSFERVVQRQNNKKFAVSSDNVSGLYTNNSTSSESLPSLAATVNDKASKLRSSSTSGPLHSRSSKSKNDKDTEVPARDRYFKKLYQFFPNTLKKSSEHLSSQGISIEKKVNKGSIYHSNANASRRGRKTRKSKPYKAHTSDTYEDQKRYRSYSESTSGSRSEVNSWISDTEVSTQSMSTQQEINFERKKSEEKPNSSQHSRKSNNHKPEKDLVEKPSKPTSNAIRKSVSIVNSMDKLNNSDHSKQTCHHSNNFQEDNTTSKESTNYRSGQIQTFARDTKANNETKDVAHAQTSKSQSKINTYHSVQEDKGPDASNVIQLLPLMKHAKTTSDLEDNNLQYDIINDRNIEATIRKQRDNYMRPLIDSTDKMYFSTKNIESQNLRNQSLSNERFESNLQQFNEYVSTYQLGSDKTPATEESTYTTANQTSTQQGLTAEPEEINVLKEERLDNKEPILKSSYLDRLAWQQKDNNTERLSYGQQPVTSREDKVFSNKNSPFKLPFSQTYLPEKEKLSLRQLDKETLLTRSFQRQYKDSELSVLTASQKFSPEVPSFHKSSGLNAFKYNTNQENARKYNVIDSDRLDQLDKARYPVGNSPYVQTLGNYSLKESHSPDGSFVQKTNPSESYQTGNQYLSSINNFQSLHSKPEVFRSLREKLLSNQAFEAKIKSLYQKLPNNKDQTIPNSIMDSSNSENNHTEASSSHVNHTKIPMTKEPASSYVQNNSFSLNREYFSRQSNADSKTYASSNSPSSTLERSQTSTQSKPKDFTERDLKKFSNFQANSSNQKNPIPDTKTSEPQKSLIGSSSIGPQPFVLNKINSSNYSTTKRTTHQNAFTPTQSTVASQTLTSAPSKVSPETYTGNQSRTSPVTIFSSASTAKNRIVSSDNSNLNSEIRTNDPQASFQVLHHSQNPSPLIDERTKENNENLNSQVYAGLSI